MPERFTDAELIDWLSQNAIAIEQNTDDTWQVVIEDENVDSIIGYTFRAAVCRAIDEVGADA